jgi:hypothetical protein
MSDPSDHDEALNLPLAGRSKPAEAGFGRGSQKPSHLPENAITFSTLPQGEGSLQDDVTERRLSAPLAPPAGLSFLSATEDADAMCVWDGDAVVCMPLTNRKD